MEPTILAANIAALRAHLGLTQALFAARLGEDVPQSYVSKWENLNTEPLARPMARLALLAGVSVEDFMDKPWSPGERPQVAPIPTLEDIAAEHGLIFVDEIDLALGMGATYLDGGQPEVLGIVPFRESGLRGLYDGPVGNLKVVRGRGDSMEPTIREGDTILVDTSQRRIDDQDRIWAVAYGELGMIRRIRVTSRGSWMLMPDNQVVRPDEVTDGEAAIIGRVIWIGRRI